MRFDQVILDGHDDIVLFDRNNPLSSPYVSRTIDGLGPTEANVNLARTTQGAGIYIDRRPQLREIICNINMNPDYTIGETPETLRQRLYLMRPNTPDGSLTLKLMLNGAEVARTPVYIKRMEMTPFSKDNLLQLVLSSPRENFHRHEDVILSSPAFSKTTPIFPNEGSASTGFNLTVQFTGPMTMFGLRRVEEDKALTVKHNFVSGDILEIDTRIGSRGVWLTKGGVRTSLLGALYSDSTWLSMYSQENQLSVIKGASDSSNFNWLGYRYQPQYLGA